MKATVLYHPRTRPTGRKLAAVLGVTGTSLTARVAAMGSLIRWGSQRVLSGSTPRDELNGPRSLSVASDKLRSLQLVSTYVSELGGMGTVPFSASPQDLLDQASRLSFPDPIILGRNRHGSQGKDIRIFVPEGVLSILREKYTSVNPRITSYTTQSLPRGFEFYTLYVPNTREYRIHVFRDRILRIQGKYLDFENEHDIPYIKNYGQGYRFRAPNRELKPNRMELATQAVSALGLDFGAVDLIVGTDDRPYFLEVNTAPACSPLTLRGYAEAFAEALDLDVDHAYLERLCRSNPDT